MIFGARLSCHQITIFSAYKKNNSPDENKHLPKEFLNKGKDQYSWPPSTFQFRSAAFHTETTFFNKTTYLNKEVNCTEPSPSVKVPCLKDPQNTDV
jgi:hypothetical protein